MIAWSINAGFSKQIYKNSILKLQLKVDDFRRKALLLRKQAILVITSLLFLSFEGLDTDYNASSLLLWHSWTIFIVLQKQIWFFCGTFNFIFENLGSVRPTKLKRWFALIPVKTMNCKNCQLFFVIRCYKPVSIEN